MAKIEAHRVPGLGQLIRTFGTFSVRRGESDREAVRMMRQIVRDGLALGLFVEGTRQRSGVPGTVQPGAAMVALQEDVPIVPVAIHGSQTWRAGNFHPVSLAWGEPMRFDGLPRGGRGYKEASVLLEQEIRRLWDWLVEMHALGRPAGTPPP
jgi:1-acyl-sn-glycerol-3-phosphate acyltransferase